MRHNECKKALANYRQAVDKHNFAPAMHRLGVYYFKQSDPDYKQAKKYFEQAAASGYEPSKKNLQIMADKSAKPTNPWHSYPYRQQITVDACNYIVGVLNFVKNQSTVAHRGQIQALQNTTLPHAVSTGGIQ